MATGCSSNNVQQFDDSLSTNSFQYDKGFPFFREPLEIGKFSLDESRQFKNNSSQLKYYYPPKDSSKCKFDLRSGYGIMIHKDEDVKEYIDTLLQWIMESKDRFLIKKSNPHSQLKEGNSQEQDCYFNSEFEH